MSDRYPVKTVDLAYATVRPDEALPIGDPRYVALDEVRGNVNLAASLLRRIRSEESSRIGSGSCECACVLVTGHRGCGKTTELLRLSELLGKAGFAVVYFDAEAEFDLHKQAVTWTNILLEMVFQIDTQASEILPGLRLPQEAAEEVAEWVGRVVTKRTERREMEASLDTEVSVTAGLSFFAKAKAVAKGLFKTGSSTVREFQLEAERRPQVLIAAVQDIIAAVNAQLQSAQRPALVIIVDGLEKIPLSTLPNGLTTHAALFIHNADQLKAPPCHVIYTVPLGLLSSAKLLEAFPSRPFMMPMVHVTHRNGRRDTLAVRILQEVVEKRVDPALFEPGVVESLALASGGHIRDLLHLVREAAAGFGERITRKDGKQAIQFLIDDYNRLIDQDLVQTLLGVSENKDLPGGPHDGEAVNRLLVLAYRNDEQWLDLHPCVRQTARFQRALRAAPKTAE